MAKAEAVRIMRGNVAMGGGRPENRREALDEPEGLENEVSNLRKQLDAGNRDGRRGLPHLSIR